MGWIVHWAHGVHPGSVIVQVIDQNGVTILESKNQSPVPANPHCEVSLQGSVKWVQFPSRYIHVVWGLRGIQASQLPCDLGSMVRLNPCLATRFIESLQALVAETFDHAALCIVTPRRSTARMASRFWRIPRSIWQERELHDLKEEIAWLRQRVEAAEQRQHAGPTTERRWRWPW